MPTVSVIVPTYNSAEWIGGREENGRDVHRQVEELDDAVVRRGENRVYTGSMS